MAKFPGSLFTILGVIGTMAWGPALAHCPKLLPVDEAREQVLEHGVGVDRTAPLRPMDITEIGAICKRQPDLILCIGGKSGRYLSLAEVRRVDAKLRSDFEYRSDAVQYGKEDYWNGHTTCGDCEDYALSLAQEMVKAGALASSMGLMLWYPAPGSAHATLLIYTRDAGWYEIGVGDYPEPFNETKGTRVAYVPMDGGRKVVLYMPRLYVGPAAF